MKVLKAACKRALNSIGYEIRRREVDVPRDRPGRQRIVVNAYYKGRCFKCFYDDYLGRSVLTGRGWDNGLEQIISRIYDRDPSGDVVEIGANIGASLLPIACQYPGFQFHCVEPVPAFFSLLEANAESFRVDNARLYNAAVSSAVGQRIVIHTQVGTAGALPTYDAHRPVDSIEAETVTVDSLFRDRDVKFLKLDVDRFEMEVLKGARQVLSRCRPVCFIEFHTKLMRQFGVNPTELTDFLQAMGYNAVTVYSSSGELLAKTASYGDVLALADSARYYVDLVVESD